MKFHTKPTEAQKAFVDRYVLEYNMYVDDHSDRAYQWGSSFASMAQWDPWLASMGCSFPDRVVWNKSFTFLLVGAEGVAGTSDGIELTFSARAWKAIFGLAYCLYRDGQCNDAFMAVMLAVSIFAVAFPSIEEPQCVVTTLT